MTRSEPTAATKRIGVWSLLGGAGGEHAGDDEIAFGETLDDLAAHAIGDAEFDVHGFRSGALALADETVNGASHRRVTVASRFAATRTAAESRPFESIRFGQFT